MSWKWYEHNGLAEQDTGATPHSYTASYFAATAGCILAGCSTGSPQLGHSHCWLHDSWLEGRHSYSWLYFSRVQHRFTIAGSVDHSYSWLHDSWLWGQHSWVTATAGCMTGSPQLGGSYLLAEPDLRAGHGPHLPHVELAGVRDQAGLS